MMEPESTLKNRRNLAVVLSLILLMAGHVEGILVSSIPELSAPMGVSVEDGQTVFRVWAPHARSVAVIGDFNNWRPRLGDHFEIDRRTGIWTGSIAGTRPRGSYQYLINDELRRRDPYARAVTEDGTRSLFYDPGAYRWRNQPPPRYELEELVIYEMHIGTFYDPQPNNGRMASFDDAIRRLDHLADLGVNTVCILPVKQFNGGHSWGYNPSDIFAIENSYGGPDAFKRFVEACHQRGLAVHVDIVHNHYGPENLDLWQFDGSGSGSSDGGIYFFSDHRALTPWGPRPDFEHPMVRRFIKDNVIMWLEEYRVDGFRWDAVANIWAYADGRRPIPAGSRMLDEINQAIRTDYPARWSIAEDSLDIGLFHGSWEYDFHHQVIPSLSARSDLERNMRQVAGALTRRPRRMWRIVYVDSHDEAGKLNNEMRIASDIDPANPDSDYARRLGGLGAVLTLTAPGIPMIFMGNEFQESGAWHDDTPLDWSRLRQHAGTARLHRDLITLRRNLEGHSGGLKGLQIQTPVVDDLQKHLVYWRAHERNPTDQVVVAINFSGEEAAVTIPFPSVGPWLLRLDSDWVRYGGQNRAERPASFTLATGAQAQTRMPPYSARIFSLVNRPVHSPAPAEATPVHREPATFVEPTRPHSVWRTVSLVGNFNNNDATAAHLELIGNFEWEGAFFFDLETPPRFKLVANETQSIFWGRPEERFEESESMQLQLRRGVPDVMMRTPWQGLYRFHFHDQTLLLTIERIGDEPLAEESPERVGAAPLSRTWTDVNGRTMEATLLSADFGSPLAVLETADGRQIEVPVRSLSPADREVIREWILERGESD